MPIDLSTVPGCIVSGDVLTINCIPYLVQNAIFWLLVFAGTVAVILIIVAGIKFILSGGDPKQTEGARKTLTFAIGGLILIMLSFAIVRFIAQTTGLNCITRFGFSHCNPQENRDNRDRNRGILETILNPRNSETSRETAKSCSSYGVGASECGNGKYCGVDLKCKDLPEQNSNNIDCASKSLTTSSGLVYSNDCGPSKDPKKRPGKSGYCLPIENPDIPNCSVPGTCRCAYDL